MTRHAHGYRIRGEAPWKSKQSAEMETADRADTQTVAYQCDRAATCSRGGRFTQVFAAEVRTPPPAVDCRCGGTGRREGAPADAVPVTPKYGPHEWQLKGTRHGDDITPMGQLMKRRTTADLEKILAERITQLREGAA